MIIYVVVEQDLCDKLHKAFYSKQDAKKYMKKLQEDYPYQGNPFSVEKVELVNE